MAWVAKTDGVDGYFGLAAAVTASTDAYIEIKFRIESLTGTFVRLISNAVSGSNTDRIILENNGNRVIVNSGGGTAATWSSVFAGALTVGQIITIRVVTTGSASKRLYIDGVDKGLASTDFSSLGRWRYFGVNNGEYAHVAFYYITYVDNSNSANNLDLQPDSSSHGAGTAVIVDVANSRDATAVNLPTDGSVWEDLGGGGTVYTLIVQSSSQLQSSQNAALSTDSVLAVSSSSQIQISSVSGLLSKSVLFLNDSSQGQVSENVSSSIGVLLAASGSAQTQSSQSSQLVTSSFIAPQLSSQVQSSDNAQLFVAGVLSVQSTASGQYSQNASLQIAVPQITVQGSGQLSASTSVTLTTHSMLSVSSSSQEQLSASVFFTGDIYHLDGQILMYSDLSGNLSLYPNITATLRIN